MKDKQLLALVKKASKQDKGAFDTLCNLKAREIIYLCTCEMRNPHDGEDAAQEVFIRMQRSIGRLQAPEAFNVWLNRLIHNTCVNMKRDSMKHKNALSIDSFDDSFWQDDSQFSLPQEYMEDAEKRRQVAEAIENLPEKYRSCILLHYYQHLSYADIADVLDISTDAVNNNMRMARKHLRLELEELEAPAEAGKGAKLASLAAAAPLLALSLQEAAVIAVPQSLIAGCLASAGIGVTAGAAGSSAAGAGLAGAKLIAPIVATVAIAAGAVGIVAYNAPRADEAPPAISQPAPQEPAPSTAPPPAAPAAPADATLSGQVALTSGGGLGGVTLTLVDMDGAVVAEVQTLHAPREGLFEFAGIPLGEYRLTATLPDYQGNGAPHSLPILIGGDSFVIGEGNRDSFTDLDIQIELPTRLHGYLALHLDNETLNYEEQNLPGVRVLLLNPAGEVVAEAPVSREGTYAFADLPIHRADTYTLRVAVDEAVLGFPLQVQDAAIYLYPGYNG